MNRNTAGAVLMLVLAAAGIWYGKPVAVALVVLTCGLTFIAEDIRSSPDGMLSGHLSFVPIILALLTWATTVGAMIILVI